MLCEKCKRNRVYLCSDNRNAWCQNDCGYYSYVDICVKDKQNEKDSLIENG